MGIDQDWANERVNRLSVEELADFWAGNPDPMSEILVCCSDANLEKALVGIIRAVQISSDDLAEEAVETTLRALAYRIKGDESRQMGVVSSLISIFRGLDLSKRVDKNQA